jgi:hypothetical protein
MFCPYFIVVRVNGDEITVIDQKLEVDENYWTWDLSAHKIVSRSWVKSQVNYNQGKSDKFVADVVRNDKHRQFAEEWRVHEVTRLRKEWEELSGWTLLKEEA